MNPYRQLRLDKGLSLIEMAQALRVNVSSVQALETGAPPNPYSSIEQALADLLGIDATQRLRLQYLAWRETQGSAPRNKLLQIAK